MIPALLEDKKLDSWQFTALTYGCRQAKEILFADPKLKTQLVDLGGIILGGSSADFRTLITEETEKWGNVIRAANIKPE